jgi:hypothetical protein
VGDEDGRVPVAAFVAGLREELKEAQETRVGCVKDLGQVLGLITLRRSPQLGSR